MTVEAGTVSEELAIVRAITTIDADGDAAWRVLAASTLTHNLARVRAEWHEFTVPPLAPGEGVGVASPLLFVATGPPAWARRQGQRLWREAEELIERLRRGETDLADEMAWLQRPLRQRGARFNPTTWRALAQLYLLSFDEPAQPAHLEGSAGARWLYAVYAVPPDTEPEEAEGLVGRALEAWLLLAGPDVTA